MAAKRQNGPKQPRTSPKAGSRRRGAPIAPKGGKRRPSWRRAKSAKTIDDYAEWCRANRPTIRRITVALTERYTRTILGLRAADPLSWKGLELKCIGSPSVRGR